MAQRSALVQMPNVRFTQESGSHSGVRRELAQWQTPRVRRNGEQVSRRGACSTPTPTQTTAAPRRGRVPEQVQMAMFMVAVAMRVVVELAARTLVDDVIGRIVTKLDH